MKWNLNNQQKLLSFETQYKIISTINREERKINSNQKIDSVHSSVCYLTKQNNFNLKTPSWKKQSIIFVDLDSQRAQEEILVNIHIIFVYKWKSILLRQKETMKGQM